MKCQVLLPLKTKYEKMEILPTAIVDSALRVSGEYYVSTQAVCVSVHPSFYEIDFHAVTSLI